MGESGEELSVEEGYEAWASIYDGDGNPLVAIEGEAVRGLFGDIRGARVIDLGCGTGRHTEALVAAGASVAAALDLSNGMIQRAREKLRGAPVVFARHAMPGPLPFGDRVFELAVMGLVAEHVAELGAALAEIYRVLRPGGRLLLSTLHPDRTAEGQKARFIDPETGLRRMIATEHRTIEDYLGAARGTGFLLETERTLVVPEALGERLERARRYVGMELGWVGGWRKGVDAS